MPATTIITRNAPGRYRGFLASCACEVAPGVYVSGHMSRAVREHVWHVLNRWFPLGADYSIVMTWASTQSPGGIEVLSLGTPPYEVATIQGLAVVRKPLTTDELSSLTTEEEIPPF